MMKWRVRRRSSCQSLASDVVKSLEFLDVVLAQYEDSESKHSSRQPHDSHSCPNFVFFSDSVDGNSIDVSPDITQSSSIQSKDSGVIMSFDSSEEKLSGKQSVVSSQPASEVTPRDRSKSQPKNIRPPIPKRSSTTRLSSYYESTGQQSDEDNKKAASSDNVSSANLTTISSGERAKPKHSAGTNEAPQTVQDTAAIGVLPKDGSKCSADAVSFQIRDRLAPPTSKGASGVKTDHAKEPTRISNEKMKSFKTHSRSSSDGSLAVCHGQTSSPSVPMEKYSIEHLLELRNRFTRVRYLLQNNMIIGLDAKPPRFTPPAPPVPRSRNQSSPVGPIHSTPILLKHKRSFKMKEPSRDKFNQVNGSDQSKKDHKVSPLATPKLPKPIPRVSCEPVSSIKQFQRPVLDFQVSLEDSFPEVKSISQNESIKAKGRGDVQDFPVEEDRLHLSTFAAGKRNSPRTSSVRHRNSSLSPLREKVPSPNNTNDGKHRKGSLSSLMEKIPYGTSRASTLPTGVTSRDPSFSLLREKMSAIIPKAGTLPPNMKQTSSGVPEPTQDNERKWNWKSVKVRRQSKKAAKSGANDEQRSEPGAVKAGDKSKLFKGFWK